MPLSTQATTQRAEAWAGKITVLETQKAGICRKWGSKEAMVDVRRGFTVRVTISPALLTPGRLDRAPPTCQTLYVLRCCSVAKWRLTLCDPVDGSTPGISVLHYLPKFAQIHVHCVADAI